VATWTMDMFNVNFGQNFRSSHQTEVSVEFLHAPIPRKGSGSTTTTLPCRNGTRNSRRRDV